MSTQVTYEKLTAALHARYGRSIAELHQEVAELMAVNETLVAERDELGGVKPADVNTYAGPYPLGGDDGTPA